MGNWPVLRSWSLAQLESRFGDRTITAGETRRGHLVLKCLRSLPQREMAPCDFIERLHGGDPGCYLLSPIGELVPELLEDVRFDELVPPVSWRSVRMWMSAKDTVPALHQDLPEDLLAQVTRRNLNILIHPLHTRNVYRNSPLHGAPDFCAVDAEDADFEHFPHLRRAEPITLEQGAGDILYIPRFGITSVHWSGPSLSISGSPTALSRLPPAPRSSSHAFAVCADEVECSARPRLIHPTALVGQALYTGEMRACRSV